MAVLIDMDMPERCYGCKFCVFTNDIFDRVRMKCILSGWDDNAINVFNRKGRHKKCKLMYIHNNIAGFVAGFGIRGGGI